MKRFWLAVAVLAGSQPGWSMPPYARFYKEKYGVLPSCTMCHQPQN